MANQMSSKRKMTIALSAMGAVTLAAVVGFTAVLAAGTATVTNDINIRYTAADVAGSATAKVYHNTSAGADFATIQTNATPAADSVIFSAEDDTSTTALKGTNIDLTKSARYVVFEYAFTADTGANPYTAALTYTDGGTADKNMTMGYIATTTQMTKTAFNTLALFDGYFDGENEDDATALVAGTATAAINVTDATTTYIYVLAKVANVAQDAEMSGTFSWTLTSGAAS